MNPQSITRDVLQARRPQIDFNPEGVLVIGTLDVAEPLHLHHGSHEGPILAYLGVVPCLHGTEAWHSETPLIFGLSLEIW
jgi:hypothetical protein